MSSIRPTARLGAALTVLAVPFALVACGGTATPAADPASATASVPAAPAVSGEHNDADVSFAQTMIPHHQQAVAMAELAAGQGASAEVQQLAAQIQAAQAPEIATLTGFLQAWGAPTAAPGDTGGMPGMDHGGGDQGGMAGMDHSAMPGMMSTQQMDQLRAATGPAFDTMFLQMMVAHHQGAVADAQRELAEGVNPDAKALATRIIDSQTAEITHMQLLQAG